MSEDEIEIPKELRPFMLENAEETFLGYKNGANKQYRYGNLHIREYDDKFLVHMDKVDPRKDPMGHLIHDAPEFLVGLGCATITGRKIQSSKKKSQLLSVLGPLVSGYVGYLIAKRLKDSKVI